MTRNSQKIICIFLSITLYIIALLLPAAVTPTLSAQDLPTKYGYELLFYGILGLISLQPAWLANLCYLIALLTYGTKHCHRFGSAAFILALFSPFIVEKLLIGFYVWIASFVILLYGNNLHVISSDK